MFPKFHKICFFKYSWTVVGPKSGHSVPIDIQQLQKGLPEAPAAMQYEPFTKAFARGTRRSLAGTGASISLLSYSASERKQKSDVRSHVRMRCGL